MKTRNMILSLLAVLGVLLAACQPAAPTTAPATNPPAPTTGPTAVPPTVPPTEPPPAEEVTITIWNQWNDEYLTNIQAVFDEYTAMHPNVTIDLSKPEDVQNALSVAVPAGEGPDIIAWANDRIGDQALVGNIVALDELGVTMDFLTSTYEPAAVNGVVWQGQIWALPETQEGIAFVYNQALVTDEFLPTDPSDFDALLEKAKAFREANPDKYLVCNQGLGNPDAYHVAPIYFGFGVPSYVDDQGVAYFNSEEALAAGNWIVEFSQYAPAETSHEICSTMLIEGQAGAWWTGPWAIADIEKAGLDYGILPMGRPFVGIKALMITPNAVDRGNAEIALDIIKYFTSGEVQAKLSLVNKTIPAATTALADPEVQALATLAGFGASLNLGVPMANTPFASAQWGPAGDATTAIWNGSQTPDEALAAAQQTAEDAIAAMK